MKSHAERGVDSGAVYNSTNLPLGMSYAFTFGREQEKIPLGSKLRDLEDLNALVRALCLSVSSSTVICFPNHNAIQSLHIG